MKQQAGKWGKVAPVGTARRVAWVGDELALMSPCHRKVRRNLRTKHAGVSYCRSGRGDPRMLRAVCHNLGGSWSMNQHEIVDTKKCPHVQNKLRLISMSH